MTPEHQEFYNKGVKDASNKIYKECLPLAFKLIEKYKIPAEDWTIGSSILENTLKYLAEKQKVDYVKEEENKGFVKTQLDNMKQEAERMKEKGYSNFFFEFAKNHKDKTGIDALFVAPGKPNTTGDIKENMSTDSFVEKFVKEYKEKTGNVVIRWIQTGHIHHIKVLKNQQVEEIILSESKKAANRENIVYNFYDFKCNEDIQSILKLDVFYRFKIIGKDNEFTLFIQEQ